jgi:hypothetical protein
MPRRNTAGARKNSRRDRRQKGVGRTPKPVIPRVRLDDLVLPDGQCRFQTRKPKARFDTKDKAEKALVQAQKQRERTGSTHVEKRVYKCPEGGCGGWHLTSREQFDEKAWRERRKGAQDG